MKHIALPEFWDQFQQLPLDIQLRARKQFELLKADPSHPSVQLKKLSNVFVGGYPVWSARVSLAYRALALQVDDSLMWYWIGGHRRYHTLIS